MQIILRGGENFKSVKGANICFERGKSVKGGRKLVLEGANKFEIAKIGIEGRKLI